MKGRSTLVLLIGIVVLGAFIWIQESRRATTPSKEYRRLRIFNLDAETLVSIQFTHTNIVVECRKENGVWMAGDGGENIGRADKALVLQMIAGLNAMGKETTITEKHLAMRGLGSDEYGFSTPAFEIEVVDNQGRRSWQVGRKTPLGDMVYVRETEGKEIYTVSNVLLNLLPSEPGHLRDRTIFAGEIAGVRRLEIRGADGFIQMAKDPKSGWLVQQPLSVPAEGKEVEAYLDRLYRLRIEGFVADNVSDFSVYGLQNEARQISLTWADGSSRMLELGDAMVDRPGYVFARRADDTSVFALKDDALGLLNVTGAQFRDAVVLPMASKKVSYISVERSGDKLELALNQHGVWNISTPVSWPADTDMVQELLEVWANAVIVDFEVTTTDEPEWILHFGSGELSQTNRISVYPARGRKDGLLVQRDNDPAIFQVNIPVLSDTLVDPLHYKDKLIWHIGKNEVDKLSIERALMARQVVERQPDGAFIPSETNTIVRVDAGSVDRMLNDLEVVITTEYVAHDPKDLSIYGLADPAMVLHVGFSGTNQLGHVLLVGWETEAGYFAMVKGRDVIFLLDRSFVDTLSTTLLTEPVSVAPTDE